MPNTLTNTALQIYSNKLIMALKRKLAPIFAFSLDLSDEAKNPGDTVQVPLITAASAGNFDATTNNYKATATDITAKSVTLNKRKLSKFGVTDAQNAQFPASWWERKAEMSVNAVGGAALDDVYALVTAANYGDTDADRMALTLAGFKKAGVAAIRAAALKKKLNPSAAALCFNPDFYSALLADLDSAAYGGTEAIRTGVIPNLLGFSKIIEVPDYDSPGFVCHADAIAFANRYLAPVAPGSYDEVGTVTDAASLSNALSTALQAEAQARISGDTALSNLVAAATNAIPSLDVSGLVPYTGATGDLDLGDHDLIVGGHVEVDGRINLLGSGRYIDGLAPVSDWTSSRAASAASVSSRLGGYIPKASAIPGSASLAYWQFMEEDGMVSGLAVGQPGKGETVLSYRGVEFFSDDAALWRGDRHYPVPTGPTSPLSTLADVAGATNALVQTYFLGTNAYLIVSNNLLRIEREEGGTNALLWAQAAQQAPGIDPAATNMLWQAVHALQQQVAALPGPAWGDYAPDGSPNPDPDYMVYVNRPALMHGSGLQWATSGACSVLAQSGAVAFASGADGEARWGLDLQTNYVGFVKGGSIIVGAQAQSVHYDQSGQEINITYPYEGGDFPTLWYTPDLSLPFSQIEGVWSVSGDGTKAFVYAYAGTSRGFYYATTSSSAASYFVSKPPIRADGGIFGATNSLPVVYNSTITVQSGGHSYRIPAQFVE
ncbi:MAG TPA: hypothetical protein P5026_07910 [Kiritimatiellia bacterium]|nr:hypothetical protein [Kiritimatiellia bacterium]HRU10247.1 hypothetical protein [Thermoanaerobaculia bacterium]